MIFTLSVYLKHFEQPPSSRGKKRVCLPIKGSSTFTREAQRVLTPTSEAEKIIYVGGGWMIMRTPGIRTSCSAASLFGKLCVILVNCYYLLPTVHVRAVDRWIDGCRCYKQASICVRYAENPKIIWNYHRNIARMLSKYDKVFMIPCPNHHSSFLIYELSTAAKSPKFPLEGRLIVTALMNVLS